MPVQGFTRARKHQFTREVTFDTPIAATQAYAFSGVPSVNLNWTDPDVDTGSIVKTVAPYRGPSDLTAPLTTPALTYNHLPLLMCGIFGGHESAVTVASTGRRWTHKPSSVDPLDPRDSFTYEFGDDVLTDWFQLAGGIIETLTITGPEGFGAVTAAPSWRFASARSTGSTDSPVVGTVPTPDLDVESNPAYVYMKDLGIYIANDVAGLAGGQILNALHNFTLTINAVIDQKRLANATQSFDVTEFALAGYDISLAATFAKTADTVGTGSEADAWFSDDAVDRMMRLKFTSTSFVGGSTPYAWQATMPARYYTREDGESGNNTTVTLTANAFYEPDDFDGFFESIATTTLTEAELGTIGS